MARKRRRRRSRKSDGNSTRSSLVADPPGGGGGGGGGGDDGDDDDDNGGGGGGGGTDPGLPDPPDPDPPEPEPPQASDFAFSSCELQDAEIAPDTPTTVEAGWSWAGDESIEITFEVLFDGEPFFTTTNTYGPTSNLDVITTPGPGTPGTYTVEVAASSPDVEGVSGEYMAMETCGTITVVEPFNESDVSVSCPNPPSEVEVGQVFEVSATVTNENEPAALVDYDIVVGSDTIDSGSVTVGNQAGITGNVVIDSISGQEQQLEVGIDLTSVREA